MLNEIVVMGRMVRDPELRRTGNGTAVASFTLACERDVASKDAEKKEVDFIDCVAWRGTGESAAKYFTKGRLGTVTGRLQFREWTDKDGKKRRNAEILVDHIYFCGSKESGAQDGSGTDNGYSAPAYHASAPAANFAELDGDDGQLPF